MQHMSHVPWDHRLSELLQRRERIAKLQDCRRTPMVSLAWHIPAIDASVEYSLHAES